MRLSTRCRYGSRALLEIGRNYGKKPTKRKEISEIQGISDSYLENILITLKSAGIINTRRGANGGYVLSRPPREISMLDVARVLEGTQAPVGCLQQGASCARSGACATQDVWRDVWTAEETVLRNATIQNLIDKDIAYNKIRKK